LIVTLKKRHQLRGKVMVKRNCWEIMQCGREPGGSEVDEYGVCPASVEKKLDSINQGRNGGRSCWGVGGTMCSGYVDGTFAKKIGTCMSCEFFKRVQEEEGAGWIATKDILAALL